MTAHFFILAAGVLFLLTPMMTSSSATAEPEEKMGFSLCLTTDKAVYSSGETIKIIFQAINHTQSEVVLRFRDAQRFDFRLEQDDKEVWRWSKGRIFTQVLGEERLRPGESMTFSAKFDEKLQPGKYRITGMIVADPSPLAASSNIVIR